MSRKIVSGKRRVRDRLSYDERQGYTSKRLLHHQLLYGWFDLRYSLIGMDTLAGNDA